MLLFRKEPSHCCLSTLPLAFLGLCFTAHGIGEERGRKQEAPRKELTLLPRRNAALFCPGTGHSGPALPGSLLLPNEVTPRNWAPWNRCHTSAEIASNLAKAQGHCRWRRWSGSVERALRITQDYRALQNACGESVDCHCLYEYREDLDFGGYCSCKVREIYHLYQHILGMRPK